jgi:hypothetical protein
MGRNLNRQGAEVAKGRGAGTTGFWIIKHEATEETEELARCCSRFSPTFLAFQNSSFFPEIPLFLQSGNFASIRVIRGFFAFI